jgi:DNA repair protein RAD5
VLLATLKSGGMGLNLIAANNVLITDPWWNAAAELQVLLTLY